MAVNSRHVKLASVWIPTALLVGACQLVVAAVVVEALKAKS